MISFSSQVTTNLEIRKNLPSKSFMSSIETGNKLSLKENFRTFRHKKATGVGDSEFEGKAYNNQSINLRYFGDVLGYSYSYNGRRCNTGKTNVFHNVFKVWMNCGNTMEKLWKSSSTIFSLFHFMELKLNVELVC